MNRTGFPPNTRRGAFFLIAAAAAVSVVGQDDRPPHQVLPDGVAPEDSRLGQMRSLDSYFPFTPPKTEEQWEKRAVELREHLQFSLGLWPWPDKTPLNAVFHGVIDQGDYTVEKVYFESLPGFFVTGNLYRPRNVTGPVPGVLCPHGHYRDGRFLEQSEAEVDAQVSTGAEEFRSNAKSPLQARCAHLARMGCTVFHYDMIGYADSIQIPHSIAHGFARQRPHMIGADGWGLFSPRAEAHLQSVMGLQTWNSIRALDFLESLPEVDSNRLGVTGSSGGGTQTFILCALDPRPAVAFPAVMVSTAMQGGCTCENCCYLRIGTGNVEIAALFAPKPLAMTAADDWTKEMEIKGFPELKQLYAVLGKPDNVQLTARTEFPHNYNQVSREAMYCWFDKHLQLNGMVEEEPIEFLSRDQLTVWDQQHPAPAGGEEFEKQLLEHLKRDSQSQLGPARDDHKNRLLQKLQFLAERAHRSEMTFERVSAPVEAGGLEIQQHLITDQRRQLPAVTIRPRGASRSVIWLSESGKAGLFQADGMPAEPIRMLADAGFAVTGIDLLNQGELALRRPRLVRTDREAAGYTFGYNPPLILSQLGDLLDSLLDDRAKANQEVVVVALDRTAVVALLASLVSDAEVSRMVLNTSGARLADLGGIDDDLFFPGAAKFGDVPGLLQLWSPRDLLLFGEADGEWLKTAYPGVLAGDNVTFADGAESQADMAMRAARWLIQSGND